MNLPSFDIIIVCTGYASKLDVCLYYWSKMKYSNFRVFIITYSKDIETIAVCEKHEFATTILYDGDKFHYKGYLIHRAIHSISNPSDYIILSDADMVFDPSTLMRISSSLLCSENKLISSLREDISERDLPLFFSNYKKHLPKWVWENISREILSPSPFMGWLLVFPSSYINRINFYVDHKGYDVIDWKIYGQLISYGLKKEIIHIDNEPLHIYHGPKGENWQGINW